MRPSIHATVATIVTVATKMTLPLTGSSQPTMHASNSVSYIQQITIEAALVCRAVRRTGGMIVTWARGYGMSWTGRYQYSPLGIGLIGCWPRWVVSKQNWVAAEADTR